MELSELKLITASNIIKLRTSAGMTQAELGAKLNYSDKTISKWERGEAIPDAYVLLQMSEIFSVPVGDLLTSHDKWTPPPEETPEPFVTYTASRIILVALLGVLTLTLTAFVIFWLAGLAEWRVFVVGASVSLLVHFILDSIFYKGQHLRLLVPAFVFSLFLILYFFLPQETPWPLLPVAALAAAVAYLACTLRTAHPGAQKQKKAAEK